MKNLVGRKIIALEDSFLGLTKGKEYKIVKQTNDKFWFITDKGTKEYTFLINSVLFKLVDEPQFKQGDKVLVSNDMVNWFEGIFICLYKDYKIVKAKDGTLRYATNIKPCEDEIKVGDWVHNSDGHVLKCKYLGLNNNPNWIKITNQDLIDKLNKL